MLEKVYNYIKENKILESGDSVILGISGGADSVCLLVVMKELISKMDLNLTAVHINHGIRGREADADMEYVESLCKKMHVEYYGYKADIVKEAEEKKCSTEEAGRMYRYRKFAETAQITGANKIAVAHNMNDNSETVIMNLFRGTGLKGLCGIPVKRENIVRPLLCISRKEIEKFLDDRKIEYRTDSTNLTDEYTRNRIRHEILPYAETKINSHAVENIAKVSQNLSEIEDYLEEQTQKALEQTVHRCDDKVLIKEGEWNGLHDAIKKRIIRKCIFMMAGRLKDITEKHIMLVMELWKLESGKSLSLPYNICVARTYDGVEFRKKSAETEALASAEKCTEININIKDALDETLKIHTDYGTFEISSDNPGDYNKIEDLLYTKWFDCDKIYNNLQIRTRRDGDYLEINDAGGRKKLKSFFIDMKIPREKRDDIILLADGSHILWIVGYRISNRYKVSADTKRCIKIKYHGEKDER